MITVFPDDVRAVRLRREVAAEVTGSGCSNRGGDRIESNIGVIGRDS